MDDSFNPHDSPVRRHRQVVDPGSKPVYLTAKPCDALAPLCLSLWERGVEEPAASLRDSLQANFKEPLGQH